MPSKYTVRRFVEGGVYHVFNRGVEKRSLFLDVQDYKIFLYYLFVYTAPLKKVVLSYPRLPIRLRNKNLNEHIEVIAYCLMPNHFHLLLRQSSINAVSKLIKQVTNAYTQYFNKKYARVGGLMQGSFKAAEITTDELLIHVSRYVHLNPIASELVDVLENYKWSSYLEYVGNMDRGICNKNLILGYFPRKQAYKEFIFDQEDYIKSLGKIERLIVDP
ncbi:MAG: transposase [Patescibacteria group bacterium]|nr:transposase [Patescibacteria group bacterium]